jgi:uncharacterized membrane protein
MTILMIGLAIFLGIHSVRIFAAAWRAAQIARMGETTWKLVFSALSAVGLVLIVWGYGAAREAPLVLWNPPMGMRHAASLLTLVAFVFLAAAYVPRNHIKARFHHPMVLGVKAWALGHLLSNGSVADLLLFGSFLAWAVFAFIRRDRAAAVTYPAGSVSVRWSRRRRHGGLGGIRFLAAWRADRGAAVRHRGLARPIWPDCRNAHRGALAITHA